MQQLYLEFCANFVGIFYSMDEKQIRNFISRVEEELKAQNNSLSALLIQCNISGQTYLYSYGDLNTLGTPKQIFRKKEILLTEFIGREIELSTIRESTKVIHLYTQRLIQEFSPEIKLQEITGEYLLRWEKFLSNEKKLSINSVGKHMKVLKKYINLARKQKLIQEYPFLNYSIKSEQTHRESLTEEQIKKLEAYRESLAEPNEALNAFLFSCYTGLRYSDVRKFTKQNIVVIGRRKWLVIRTMKTGKMVKIPMMIFGGKALKITKSIPRSRGEVFKLESSQKTNRELSKIAKIVGIRKLNFHMARHSCATLLLYKGMNITSVQTILGHQSVKTTQIYSAVTELTLIKEVKKSNGKGNK